MENHMSKTIFVKTKNVYGKELVYPVCKDAVLFASLAKTKTLSDNDLGRILDLGYQILEAPKSPLIQSIIQGANNA
jgi:tRNA1(Val) A37 N6-methylase TrmN6